jgi:hypothetical protein
MAGNIAIDVVIGHIFVYLLYCILGTIVQEFIATFFIFRAKMLELAIFRMPEEVDKYKPTLDGLFCHFRLNWNKSGTCNTLAGGFYDLSLIRYLSEGSFRPEPSCILGATFSKIIVYLLHGNQAMPRRNCIEEKTV